MFIQDLFRTRTSIWGQVLRKASGKKSCPEREEQGKGMEILRLLLPLGARGIKAATVHAGSSFYFTLYFGFHRHCMCPFRFWLSLDVNSSWRPLWDLRSHRCSGHLAPVPWHFPHTHHVLMVHCDHLSLCFPPSPSPYLILLQWTPAPISFIFVFSVY